MDEGDFENVSGADAVCVLLSAFLQVEATIDPSARNGTERNGMVGSPCSYLHSKF